MASIIGPNECSGAFATSAETPLGCYCYEDEIKDCQLTQVHQSTRMQMHPTQTPLTLRSQNYPEWSQIPRRGTLRVRKTPAAQRKRRGKRRFAPSLPPIRGGGRGRASRPQLASADARRKSRRLGREKACGERCKAEQPPPTQSTHRELAGAAATRKGR